LVHNLGLPRPTKKTTLRGKVGEALG